MTREELAKRIKDRRVYLSQRDEKFTQQYVADQLGISREAYAKYEQARNDLRALDVINLAKILQTTPQYFYGDEDDEGRFDEDVMLYYNGMPPTLRPAAKAALKAMFDQQDKEDAVTTVGKKAE